MISWTGIKIYQALFTYRKSGKKKKKIADCSVIVTISVKTNKRHVNVALTSQARWKWSINQKFHTKVYKNLNVETWINFVEFTDIEETKVFHFPVSEVKTVPKALTTWFNITYIFIRHQISNLFLVMWSQCFQNDSTVQENKSEENICLEATYLEPKLSFFNFV